MEMGKNCAGCGKNMGFLEVTQNFDNETYCEKCSNKKKADKDIYIPDEDAIKRALSGLLTQDPDTKKLFAV